MRDVATTVLELVGVALIVAGVGLQVGTWVSLPAGCGAAGVASLLFSLLAVRHSTPRVAPVPGPGEL